MDRLTPAGTVYPDNTRSLGMVTDGEQPGEEGSYQRWGERGEGRGKGEGREDRIRGKRMDRRKRKGLKEARP